MILSIFSMILLLPRGAHASNATICEGLNAKVEETFNSADLSPLIINVKKIIILPYLQIHGNVQEELEKVRDSMTCYIGKIIKSYGLSVPIEYKTKIDILSLEEYAKNGNLLILVSIRDFPADVESSDLTLIRLFGFNFYRRDVSDVGDILSNCAHPFSYSDSKGLYDGAIYLAMMQCLPLILHRNKAALGLLKEEDYIHLLK